MLELNPLKERKAYIGLSYTEDDAKLHQCIEEVHRRGMDFWLYYSGMHGAEKHKNWCAVDFNGVPFSDLAPIPYAVCQLLITYCPSRTDIRAWNRAAYTFGASEYDVDAVYVTHFRYANPSFFTNIFGCACESCEKEAEKKGYNFLEMKKACLLVQRKLTRMKIRHLKEAAKLRLSFMDFLTLLVDDQAILTRQMSRKLLHHVPDSLDRRRVRPLRPLQPFVYPQRHYHTCSGFWNSPAMSVGSRHTWLPDRSVKYSRDADCFRPCPSAQNA